MKKHCTEYDLVCSLGGNCSVAHNLSYRGLRRFALPFDWTYFSDINALYHLADSFAIQFNDQLLRENLKELPTNTAHLDKIQYEDTKTKIIWANHFTTREDKEYHRVKRTIERRFKRLIQCIKQSKTILFMLAMDYEVDIEPIHYLYKKVSSLYPEKQFIFRVLSFNCTKEEVVTYEHIELYKYTRSQNVYDYIKTNFEWSFLDTVTMSTKIKINPLSKIIKVFKVRRGGGIRLFSMLPTLFRIRLYCFSMRFDLCIGKAKE